MDMCEMVPAVAIGENVTLSCNFTLPLDILQITWQKRKGYSFENIATSSKRHRPKSVGLFQNRVLFTNTSLNASSITLCNVTLQDEGDYKCLFNAFPHGSFSRNTHLTVQAVSEIRTELHVNFINEGILTAICSATGKPAPKITWRPEGVLTAHHPEVGSVHNADGTVTVTNACNFTLERLKSLTCVMDHPEGSKKKILYQEEDKRQEEYEGFLGMAVQMNSSADFVLVLPAITRISFTFQKDVLTLTAALLKQFLQVWQPLCVTHTPIPSLLQGQHNIL
uniref:Ig-like domain-containing protein n=1 Tax=Crocodylus porosus TaxID=8502 RepID=A0A7M4ERV1_CROPO